MARFSRLRPSKTSASATNWVMVAFLVLVQRMALPTSLYSIPAASSTSMSTFVAVWTLSHHPVMFNSFASGGFRLPLSFRELPLPLTCSTLFTSSRFKARLLSMITTTLSYTLVITFSLARLRYVSAGVVVCIEVLIYLRIDIKTSTGPSVFGAT
jgi:hypothetical protein